MVSFISTSCAPPSEIVMGDTSVRRALSRISGMESAPQLQKVEPH